MFRTLHSRLVLSYIAIILVCLGLTSAGALLFLRGYQRNVIYSRLTDRGDFAMFAATSLLRRGQAEEDAVSRLAQLLNRRGGPVTHLYLLDREGLVVAGSDDRLDGQAFTLPGGGAGATPSVLARGERRLDRGLRLLYVALPVRSLLDTAEQSTGYALVLGELHRPVVLALGDLLPRLFWAGVIALALSVVLAAWLARSIARPLGRIARASEEISAGNYDQSVNLDGPTEVARLAASFDSMARQVQHTLQSQQNLLANVSHELKTPLTSIQGFSQALVDGTASEPASQRRAAAVIYEEAGRMRKLVEELLDLARMESGQVALKRQAVDVGELLNDCASRFSPQARESGCQIVVEEVTQGTMVTGDADRLGQVLDNLLDNAIKHAGATPGTAKVQLRAERKSRWVCLSVTDNGPGIASRDLERVFERFYRGDKSRSRQTGPGSGAGRTGAGLGLAISREIAKAHGGDIRAESVEGLGTRFTVYLPTQEASSSTVSRSGETGAP